MPPSTGIDAPVTDDAASESSHVTASAISEGRPMRAIGSTLTSLSLSRGCVDSIPATIAVSITPGQTALTRIPVRAYSSAAVLVKPITPCLEAL